MLETKSWSKPKFDPRPRSNSGSTHVRFSNEQFEKIKRDAELSGESMPNLLKEAYFNGQSRVPLMRKDDAAMVISELNRIGVNFNQVAHHLNSGFREGFHEQLEQIATDLNRLTNSVMFTYSKGREE